MKKILIRGGGIPAGAGVNKSYVDMITPELIKNGFEVINRSRDRETSFDGIRSFYEDIDKFRPDVLIIHFGIDDIYRPVYRSEFKENLVQIVRLARHRFNPEIFLLTSHPFESSIDMDAAGIFYKTIREVATDLDCRYVPAHMWWISHIDETGKKLKDFVQNDSRYPNEEGHEIYAKILIRAIREIINGEKNERNH